VILPATAERGSGLEMYVRGFIAPLLPALAFQFPLAAVFLVAQGGRRKRKLSQKPAGGEKQNQGRRLQLIKKHGINFRLKLRSYLSFSCQSGGSAGDHWPLRSKSLHSPLNNSDKRLVSSGSAKTILPFSSTPKRVLQDMSGSLFEIRGVPTPVTCQI